MPLSQRATPFETTAMNRPVFLLPLAVLMFAPGSFAGETASNHAAIVHAGAQTTASSDAPVSAPQLQATLRSLWHGHIVNTRDYAIAVHAGRATQAAKAADAVVANARQLSDAVASFYGKPAGERMMQLLAGHWGAIRNLTDARSAGDAAAQERAMATLTSNAGEIARFLAGANPNLPEDAVRGLLMAHGAHHSAQIQQIMAGDMQAERTTWTAMQTHMDTIADALAGAIARQFPDKAA